MNLRRLAPSDRTTVVIYVYLIGLVTTWLTFGIGAGYLFMGTFVLGVGVTLWADVAPTRTREHVRR